MVNVVFTIAPVLSDLQSESLEYQHLQCEKSHAHHQKPLSLPAKRTCMNAANDIRETREKQGMEESVHYILKYHLGSWTTITDADGQVEQELSYDAWGSLRNPTTWSGDFSGTPVFDRGFTGHEHLAAFGLINMNGRCYDPLTSSFLSVDAYVQDPTSAQSFNRYAYCGYNPLRYTDPTGWLPDETNPIRQCNGANYNDEPRWHSNDLNDMLWGRSVHPCETGNPYWTNNSSQDYMKGNECISGNDPDNKHGGIGGWVEDKNGIHYDKYATTATDGFLDITYVSGNDYYGLLGDYYTLDTEQGRFWKDVYDAFIKHIEDARINDPFNPEIASFSTVDFSDVTPWIPIDGPITPNQNIHVYNNSNPNLKDVLGIIAPCDVDKSGNINAMRASFGGWGTAYPNYGNSNWKDDPVYIKTLNQSNSTSFPKGYPLEFSNGNNVRAYVHFLTRETREYTKKQYNRVFGYTYHPNRP